jgi:protein-disulfide isomerase
MRVDSLLEMYPYAVQVVWHHYPLSSHELAVPAAIAVECASQQGVAREFQMAVFAQQKFLGTKPWTDLASDAGVVDTEQFGRCILQPIDSFPRITYGLELGKRVGVRGTPTVWVNGVVDRPTLERMRGMVEEAPAGSR